MFLALLQLWSLTSVFQRYHYLLYIKNWIEYKKLQSEKLNFASPIFLTVFKGFFYHLRGGYYYPEFMNLTLIIIASGGNTP